MLYGFCWGTRGCDGSSMSPAASCPGSCWGRTPAGFMETPTCWPGWRRCRLSGRPWPVWASTSERGDSRLFSCNRTGEDYGQEVLVEGIPVHVTPFTVIEGRLIQRSFFRNRAEGWDILLRAEAEGVASEDYVEQQALPDGRRLGSLTLEVVRAAKERTGREKDRTDLQALSRLPFSPERYARVAGPVGGMRVEAIW